MLRWNLNNPSLENWVRCCLNNVCFKLSLCCLPRRLIPYAWNEYTSFTYVKMCHKTLSFYIIWKARLIILPGTSHRCRQVVDCLRKKHSEKNQVCPFPDLGNAAALPWFCWIYRDFRRSYNMCKKANLLLKEELREKPDHYMFSANWVICYFSNIRGRGETQSVPSLPWMDVTSVVFKCLVGISKSPQRTLSFWTPFCTYARPRMTLWSKPRLRLKHNMDWVLIPHNSAVGNYCIKLPLWIILFYGVY